MIIIIQNNFQQQEQDPTNLYIANLPSHFDEEKLSEMLQVHGPVISSRILRLSFKFEFCFILIGDELIFKVFLYVSVLFLSHLIRL